MDDKRKKPPRRGGPKSSQGSGDGRPRRAGNAGFAKKVGGSKPLRTHREDKDDRPQAKQRNFGRDDRARPGGDKRPGRFERAERRPGDAEVSARGDRPGHAGPEGKPYAKRPQADRQSPAGQRDFARDKRPGRFERAERRAGDAEVSARGDRPGHAGPEGKPYAKRPQADRQSPAGQRDFPRDKRPGRFERAERRPGDAEVSARGDRPGRAGPEGKPYEKPQRDRQSPAGQRDFPRNKRPQGERPPRHAKPHDHDNRKPFVRAGDSTDAEGERIAKRLARVGIASRRDAEELIAAGRIRVNGKVLSSPAFNVLPSDTIELDGTPIPPIERTRLFLFNKPAGIVTTNRDPEGRKTVFDALPKDLPRLMTIGRLDINTEGLLLLTNDGGLARVLELPATGWLRRYRVRVHGDPDEKALADLKNGIAVDGIFYGSVEAVLDRQQGTNAWLTIGLREGKNREVKNILGALGLEVTRLIRISYGPFQLGELPEGQVWEMKGRTLRDQLGERLIEEAGANFEADIAKPFSNKPARREGAGDETRGERARPELQGERERIGEGGLIKRRKRDRDDMRVEALGRLSTKLDRGEFRRGRESGGKSGERADKRDEPVRARTANVWMAPGARPQGKKEALTSRSAPEGRSEGQHRKPSFGKSGKSSSRGTGTSSSSSFRERGGGKGVRPPRGKGPGKGPKGR